jgi:beta-lactamase class A
MPSKLRFFLFLSLSIFCLLLALYLTLGQMRQYNSSQAVYPAGSKIAGIPVGGLDAQAGGLRVAQTYSLTPLELRVHGATFHINPVEAGLELDLQGMLNAAGQAQAQRSYWSGFWDYLMNRPPAPSTANLFCSVSNERLHAYLQEKIAPLFDQPATQASPVPGDVLFKPGQAGSRMDLTGAEEKISAALCTPAPRVVDVEGTLTPLPALPPTVDGLRPALETLTQVMNFDGIIEVYYQDLRTGQEINFAFNQGHEISAGIAFTGASTIKIPVMISAYKRMDGPLPDELRRRMELMIDLSDNSSTDEVMKQALDPNIAPVQVTQDMQALGLENTFLAGFFYPGAPLLDRYQTVANQRTDLSTDPDIYNQTTAADMGRLLAAIQRCAADGSGLLTQTYKEQITQAECQEMTGLLAKNRKGVLIEAGLPEGTQIAHKYGWVTDSNDGLLHTASDAAIVYTPGGDFILTAYLYHPIQLPWDDAQRLVARLATAIYNFYNAWH